MSLVTNRQLFSAVYLLELQHGKHAADTLAGARQTIKEYRDDTYSEMGSSMARRAYAKQCLSTLMVANSPRPEKDGFVLFADSSKVEATGLCIVVDDDDLGRAVKGAHPQARIVRELRNASLRFGILTNGVRWRLCDSAAPAPYEVYLDADLDALINAQALDEFLLFHRFFGCDAFSAREGQIGLERFLAESDKRTAAIERHLKGQVEPILQKLCLGFVEDEAAGTYGTESLQVIYKNAIYLLYRILFLFYAEARDLLPVEHPVYQPASLGALVVSAWRHQREGEHEADKFSLWKRFTRLCAVVDDGDIELGVSAYNGGLFSDTEKPYLKNHKIRNDYLAAALFALGFEVTKTGFQPIDYRDLSVRHLGTLYEGLLEYRLNLVEREPCVVRETGGKRTFVPLSRAGAVKKGEITLEVGEVYFADDKGERKGSGSYYTPEDVVQYVVGNAVTPKLLERREPYDRIRNEVEQERAVAATIEQRQQLERYADVEALKVVEKRILTLRILDLAMGSGHFLVASAQTIANFIVETLNATDWVNEDISTDPLVWKRRVVERCIYGVDKNPLAHELAKLSLWIASASVGKPLTFLDHHLKQGNSLYGTPLSRLGNLHTSKKQTDDPLFRIGREQVVADALKELTNITQTDSDTIEVVKYKGEVNRTVHNTVQRLRMVADVWLASLFGLQTEGGRAINEEEYAGLLNDLTINYSEDSWHARVDASAILQAAQRIARENEFFHWELEFPDSVVGLEGRFDVVVKNPPYVVSQADAAITALYETARCGDLYAWLFEKALKLTGRNGNVGTVVPLSLTFGGSFSPIRIMLQRSQRVMLSSYDNIPDALFGADSNGKSMQRATIALVQSTGNKGIYSTGLLKWWSQERSLLFTKLSYVDITDVATAEAFPRIDNERIRAFWLALSVFPPMNTLAHEILSETRRPLPGAICLTLPRAVNYFISATAGIMARNKILSLTFNNDADMQLARLLLNSNVFYWYWKVFGDGFLLGVDIVGRFPAVRCFDDQMFRLSQRLDEALDECTTFKMYRGAKIPSFNFNKRMDILLDIDEWIVNHVAPGMNLPRDTFAQYKSNSFLRPLDLSALMGTLDEEDSE